MEQGLHSLIISEDNGNAAAMPEALTRLQRGERVTWVCSTPTSATLFDIEALSALKNTYMSRFNLLVITRNERQPFSVLTGPLDAHRLQECANRLFQSDTVTSLQIGCDEKLSQEITNWAGQALPPDTPVTTVQTRQQSTTAIDPLESAATAQIAVTVISLGRESSFAMNKSDGTVLDGAEQAGLDLPYSCRGGVCSTCRTKLVEGEVELLDNYALEDWELDAGFILLCQTKPLSAKITVDYDQT